VASGDERMGVDFVMRLVPTTTIAGMLFSPEGPASSYVLHLVPSDADSFSFDPDAATAVTDQSGGFMFLGVPAGQYVIQTTRISEPMSSPPPPPPPGANSRTERTTDPSGRTVITTITLAPNGAVLSQNRQVLGPPMLWAAAPIVVGDAGLEGVTLTLREGYKISGRVEFNGAGERPPAARLTQIPVMVEPADMRQRTNAGFQQPGRIGPDGTFTIAGLLPGQYLVRIGGAPGGWFAQSVTLGGADISDVPFELSDKDATGVVVTFTDRISELRGTVRGLKADAEPAAVIVYPADATTWKSFGLNPRRMRMVRASQAGSFSFGSLPPGDYLLAAVPDEYSGEWSDPAYLEVLARVAMRVTVGEGERKVQEVEIHDIRPPGGGVPAPMATTRSFPRALVGDLAEPEIAARHGQGPFVPVVPDQTPPAQVRDRPLADPVGTGSISGVVLEDGSNRPVRRARVSARTPEMRSDMLATSDDEGRFIITGLAPGPYSVVVTKPAYLTGFHGGTRPGRGPGVPLPLKAGQKLTGVTVRVARAGVISGVVMDQFGQPYASGRIRLMQVQRRDGERLLVGSGGAGTMMTDDRGVYRVYGLSPGTYAIGVMPAGPTGSETRVLSDSEMRAALADLARKDATPATTTAEGARQIPPAPPGPAPVAPLAGRAVGLATVYYPGTVIETEATHLTIAPGQELSGIDFTVMLVPTSRVEGSVLMPDGQPAVRLQVQITSTVGGTTTNAAVRINPDGTFQAVGVAPGRYAVIARMTGPVTWNAPTPPPPPTPGPPQGPPGPTFFAQQELHVSGEDIRGVVLTLGPTSTISGRIAFAGGAPAQPDGTPFAVSVGLDVFGPSRPGVGPRSMTPDKSGMFTMSGVAPGMYRLSAFVQAQAASGWMVQSAMLDGRDVFEQPFEVHSGRDHSGAVITLTDKAAELSGSITDGSGGPIAALQILLFPTDRAEWRTNSRRMRGTARSNAEGTYRFTGVRPGEYFLAVVTELEPGDWGDPAFMEQVAALAIKLVFTEGEKKVQNLRAGG